MKEIVVWIYLNSKFIPAGILVFEENGRYSKSYFAYFKNYMRSPYAIAIDPVQLPLIEKEFETPEGFELFNGIRDAGPDRWGRYLLDKKFSDGLSELDYITHTGADRSGALCFAEKDIEIITLQRTNLDLKLCADAAEQAMEGTQSEALERFLCYGPSLGGARPKATVTWGEKLYLAKFTLSMDRRNEAMIEYATMSLAKKAGLNVPNLDIVKISNRDIFLIERFDRTQSFEPIPFISGLTATGLHEQDYQKWSYLRLISAIDRFSLNPEKDRIELFKRMVFNILVFNSDDHMRNHGFLYSGNNTWSLSPLYDVVPTTQISESYMLSMQVGDYGKEASLENARSSAKYFAITPKQADEYIDELISLVKDWEPHFINCGVSEQDLNKIRHSFRSF